MKNKTKPKRTKMPDFFFCGVDDPQLEDLPIWFSIIAERKLSCTAYVVLLLLHNLEADETTEMGTDTEVFLPDWSICKPKILGYMLEKEEQIDIALLDLESEGYLKIYHYRDIVSKEDCGVSAICTYIPNSFDTALFDSWLKENNLEIYSVG